MKKIFLALILSTSLLISGCLPMMFMAASAQNAATAAELAKTQEKMIYIERGVSFENIIEYGTPKKQYDGQPADSGIILHIKVKSIKPQSDAEKAGLQVGDEIILINGESPSMWNNIHDKFFKKENEPIVIVVKRKDFEFTTKLLPL